MRYNLFAGVVFAAAMFLIPLMALNGGIQEQAGTALTSSAPPQAADEFAESNVPRNRGCRHRRAVSPKRPVFPLCRCGSPYSYISTVPSNTVLTPPVSST